MKTKMFIRATTLTVTVAAVMLTLTLMPRTAAAALMCAPGTGGAINCVVVPDTCSSWGETSGAAGPPWCFDAATAKASAEMLQKRNARMKEGGMDPQAQQRAQKEFMKAFDMAFRAGHVSVDKRRLLQENCKTGGGVWAGSNGAGEGSCTGRK